MLTPKKNIVFFATSIFARPSLELLVQAGYHLMAVVTKPDKLVGRKKILTAPPIKTVAEKLHLAVYQPESLKNTDWPALLRLDQPAENILGIIAAYGKIIPSSLLKPWPFLNLHPSLLPKYRGPSPIQTAILNGEKETGVTLMLPDEEADHGLILATQPYSISPTAYYPEIHDSLSNLAAQLLIKALPNWLSGHLSPYPQDHTQATFTKKLTWAEGRINWHEPIIKIFNLLRALNPEPGTWTTIKSSSQVIKILHGSPTSVRLSLPPGTARIENGQLLVATGDLAFSLEKVQLAGKKALATAQFLHGLPSSTSIDFS